MTANTSEFENPLTTAVQELNDICRHRKLITSPIDSGSVTRMVTHIITINRSVLASTRDHVNAAKRLNDFALTLARIAQRSTPPNEELATGLITAANNLRSASDELAGADAIPKWDAPERLVADPAVVPAVPTLRRAEQ
jgi:hypothetical protein